MSKEEYDKLFHQATLQANQEDNKSFDELQKEDQLKAIGAKKEEEEAKELI